MENKNYKKMIVELLMKTEYIEMGFTEGSTLDVYKEILEIVDEMMIILDNQVDIIDNLEDSRTPLIKANEKIKSLETELNKYKSICLDLVDDINRLRSGLSKPLKQYKEIEDLINGRNERRSFKA